MADTRQSWSPKRLVAGGYPASRNECNGARVRSYIAGNVVNVAVSLVDSFIGRQLVDQSKKPYCSCRVKHVNQRCQDELCSVNYTVIQLVTVATFQHSKIGLVILQTIQLSLYYKQYSSGYITNNTNLVKIQTSLYYKQYSSRYITNNMDLAVIQ